MKQPNAAQILQQIAHIRHMEPGKLCVIGQGPNGPYYNLQCREYGKTVSRYVPGDQVQLVTEHTANYQKFQALVTQSAQLIIEQTRAERTAGFKKRPRAGDPLGPRPRNPAVDGALPGERAQRGGGSTTGSAGSHGCLQVGQRAGGIPAPTSRRPN